MTGQSDNDGTFGVFRGGMVRAIVSKKPNETDVTYDDMNAHRARISNVRFTVRGFSRERS